MKADSKLLEIRHVMRGQNKLQTINEHTYIIIYSIHHRNSLY